MSVMYKVEKKTIIEFSNIFKDYVHISSQNSMKRFHSVRTKLKGAERVIMTRAVKERGANQMEKTGGTVYIYMGSFSKYVVTVGPVK